jgi:hypothetical protein
MKRGSERGEGQKSNCRCRQLEAQAKFRVVNNGHEAVFEYGLLHLPEWSRGEYTNHSPILFHFFLIFFGLKESIVLVKG